jgi:ubiquinone biosynthesis protein COQ9
LTAELVRLHGVTKKVRLGIKTRLEMQIPVVGSWHQAMALGALPHNLPTTVKNLALMADDVWHFAGDRSTDVRRFLSCWSCST